MRVAVDKHDSITAYQAKIGSGEYDRIRHATRDMLNDRDSSLEETEATPRILGYFPFRPLGFTCNVLHLEDELNKRMVEFDSDWTVTRKCKLLKQDEKGRFQTEVDNELQTKELVFTTDDTLNKKLEQLNKYAEENDISFGGRFTIDTNKFFKTMNNIPEEIFEEY